MHIEVDDDIKQALQDFTPLKLGPEEVSYFVDFFMWIGIATVRATLERYPDMTFGDLVMLRYRINQH